MCSSKISRQTCHLGVADLQPARFESEGYDTVTLAESILAAAIVSTPDRGRLQSPAGIQKASAECMQARSEARAGAPGLLPYMRSSSSKPTQEPRPLIAGATAHITGPPAKTAADILVEEG